MEASDKLLISKINDLFRLCQKHATAKFSAFLDGGEIATIQETAIFPYGFNTMFFGGFEESECKMLGVFPEWSECHIGEFPIKALKISGLFTKPLTHRDYLGSLLSLGIERNKLGDIVIMEDNCAICFVSEDIAPYICQNLTKIGNQGVHIGEADMSEAQEIKRKYQRLELVCASMRTDAVVSAITKLSRQKSAELISADKVKVNHRIINDNSKLVKVGDLLSIRGFGRFVIADEGAKTRKDRQHISVDKYL